MKKILFAILLILCGISFSGCSKNNDTISTQDTKEKFVFDELEITIGNKITYEILDKDFDKDKGKDVVKVPINVKNLKEAKHHLSMFYYSVKSPKNNKLSSKAESFNDSIDFADDLSYNESYTKYIYFLYDGNGMYTIQFNNGSEKKDVFIDISKN